MRGVLAEFGRMRSPRFRFESVGRPFQGIGEPPAGRLFRKTGRFGATIGGSGTSPRGRAFVETLPDALSPAPK